jgi:hypothetical protein
METTQDLHDTRLADAWATLQAHARGGASLTPDASRLAFADPEFLLRRETRGIRFQLELLKPDLEQQAMASKTPSWCLAARAFAARRGRGPGGTGRGHRRDACADPPRRSWHAQCPLLRTGPGLRQTGGQYSAGKDPADMLFICTGGGPGIMQAANRGAHEGGASA